MNLPEISKTGLKDFSEGAEALNFLLISLTLPSHRDFFFQTHNGDVSRGFEPVIPVVPF